MQKENAMDTKTIAKTGLAAAVALGAIAAQAETYYLKQNANTISPFTSANIGSYWTNSVGVAPVYGQVSASEDVFWVD